MDANKRLSERISRASPTIKAHCMRSMWLSVMWLLMFAYNHHRYCICCPAKHFPPRFPYSFNSSHQKRYVSDCPLFSFFACSFLRKINPEINANLQLPLYGCIQYIIVWWSKHCRRLHGIYKSSVTWVY